MKVITFPHLAKLQHYTTRAAPWQKFYAGQLGRKWLSKNVEPEVREYVEKVWDLSDHAKLILPYLEVLAGRQDPRNQLPYNVGWIAQELGVLDCVKRPKMLASLLAELLAKGLAELLEITAIKDARHLPLLSLKEDSLSQGSTGEGSGEGTGSADDELPAESRGISAALLLALERYELAAQKADWPLFRRGLLSRLEEPFDDVTSELLSLEPEFDWLVCFGRATEQPFVGGISGFGFDWFLRRESQHPRRLNALKVWDYAFMSRNSRNTGRAESGRCGECMNCISGLSCTAPMRASGYVVRWPGTKRAERFPDAQMAFRFVITGAL